MAKTHVRQHSGQGRYQVVFHFPVPATLNQAGVSWRDALIRSGLGGTTILLTDLPGENTAAERTEILAGAVYEHVDELLVDSAFLANVAEVNRYIDEQWTARNSRVLGEMQQRLKFFGYVRV